MPESLGLAVLLGALLGGGLAGLAALHLARRAGAAHRREIDAFQKEVRDLQRKSIEARARVDALQSADQTKEELILFYVVTLPELVRHLTSNRERRHVAPFLLQMLDVVFEPGRIGLFYATSQGESYKLAAQKGFPATVNGVVIEAGDPPGPLGWVASQRRVLTAKEVTRVTAVSREDVQGGDIYVPMIDPDADSTLGIITVTGLTKNATYAPRLLKMVADLGSLALKNAEYFRYIQGRANEDGLTGLLTKSFGLEQLSLAIHRAESENTDLSLLILDVDHFKVYNDTRGHLAGDQVLRRLGEIVREAVRADDFAIRFGGEEFIVVFQDADKRGGLLAAEKLRQRVEEEAIPFHEGPESGRVTVSGGVSSLRADARSSLGLIGRADEALYAAKKAGRNRILPYRQAYLSGGMEPHPLDAAGGRDSDPA